MNLADWSIQNRVVTLVLTFVTLGAGLVAYEHLSRLEDPEFTIKDALVVTPYPGASAAEVEEEVTDRVELAVQKLGQLKRSESKSDRGLSTVTVTIKDKYDRGALPQVWDELRRKVSDVQRELPPGAGPSLVVDDYGDVFGVFIAVSGDEYSYAELKNVVDLLRRELVLVRDVAKIETFGERVEAVYVELARDRMAQLGIPEAAIIDELRQRNVVTDAGHVRVGPEFITIEPTGGITGVEDFEAIPISAGGQEFHLRDVATVRRGYVEPPDHLMRYDGKMAIGLGISTVSGGNVVTMGEALRRRWRELLPQIPLGIEVGIVSLQSDAVTTAISGFVTSLLEAVAIVIIVLLFFMGLRSGLLIGFILLLTIVGTFIFLAPMGVALERISLGALIIALGMLVDNAIVVVDGMLIKLARGVEARRAASEVVRQNALPLLGATVVAILAFAAIGTSNDNTGEFCRSLFQVVMVSLLLSWVTAVTVTPLLGVMFLQPPTQGGGDVDPYAGGFYARYRSLLRGCIRARWPSLVVVAALFLVSLWGFGRIDQSFFPPSTRPQLMVDFWLPQGTHIDETTRQVAEVEQSLRAKAGVTHVTSLIGKGGLRFLLTYKPEKLNSAYAQLLVDVDDPARIDALLPEIEREVAAAHPDALAYASRFELGPGSNGKIRARFSGADADVLRGLAAQAEMVLHEDGNAKAIRNDWRERVKVLEPTIAETEASANGIQRPDVAQVLLQAFQGAKVGVFRERDLLLPIIMRATSEERQSVDSIRNLQIWSPAAARMIPLRQVVAGFDTVFADEIVMRRDRRRTITVFADPVRGPASVLFARVRPRIEALERPPAYMLEWGGEYEDASNAQAGLAASIPVFLLVMILVTIVLFNSLRQPLIIWLCVPLAVIGVTWGLLLTRQPFGFMALLGFLSLSGMLIKNAIVLIDEINLQTSEGKAPLAAIVDSGVSRLRPVAMAASTTALGMLPLLLDAFFVSMAVTIIAGLLFATLLTMVVVPVLYAVLYRVPTAEVTDAA
jgi:multidrug efflux pump subunit AcrB